MNAQRAFLTAAVVGLTSVASQACIAADEPADADATLPAVAAGTCGTAFPSYWQDPAPRFSAMWEGQLISNAPPADWTGPVFRLSDRYPDRPEDAGAGQPWRDARFNPMFDPDTDQAMKTALGEEYAWAVMSYIQEGNTGSGDVEADWTLCDNPVRSWFHMPFQTYDVLSGREFVHGLTREAPVTFSMVDPGQPDSSRTLASTMWAVGFYNATGAHTIGRVWGQDGTATLPTGDLAFGEGTVVGKLLFNTLTPDDLPFLAGMPVWTANISAADFCSCTGQDSSGTCTMAEQSQQCPRSPGQVALLQFDIAVKDSRARGTQWVFGTFVADGERKAAETDPWNRISPLGLLWGNDTPPAGGHAIDYPEDPRQNGFRDGVIFWDVVDMLNASGGADLSKRPGHLGCNSRLNGPADNPNSSCLSCHMTASVVDTAGHTPPIIAQFQNGITPECVQPSATDPDSGRDASGAERTVSNDISFAAMDGLYFADIPAGTPFRTTVQTASGPVNVLGDWPLYADGRSPWVSLDYSLQLSISLAQWREWMANSDEAAAVRVHDAVLPGR
jgi:hypothetical protein